MLAALAGLARGGRGDEGPIIIAHREEHPYLTLDPFKGAIELNGIYEQDKSRSGGGTATASDMFLTQQLTLSSGGTVVSRNLLEWSASGAVAAQEESSGGNTGSGGSSFGFFDAYDLNVGLLSGSQLPMSAYARKSESYVTRAFAGLLRNDVTGYGATMQYRSPTLPTMMSYNQSNTVQTDLTGKTQYAIDQTNFDFGTSFQPGERHNVSVNYSYGVINQNNPGIPTTGSQLQTVSLAHNWSIDPLAHYTLSQFLNYSQQEGTYNQTRLRLDERLRLRLTDTLDAGATYSLERQEFTTSQATSHMLNASLTHRLYESLTTTGRVGMTLTDNTFTQGGVGGSSALRNYFGNIATSYTKKLFQGRLGANLSLGYNESQSQATGQMQQVMGESDTFVDNQIILTRPGVNAATIVVLDPVTRQPFEQGRDYRVTPGAKTVKIEPIVEGRIVGNSVLLNYGVNPLPGFTSESVALGTGANYNFDEGWLKGLNVFMRYYQVDQSISPASSGIVPDSIRDTTLGAEYRVWKLTLRAEDEMHSSTLAPYDALRFSASYVENWGERTTLSINATQNYITVPTDNTRMSSLAIDGRLQYQIARDLNAAILARWRDDSYSNAGGVTGLEGQGELRWKVRQTDLFLQVRYTTLRAPESDFNSFVFQFGVSRNF